MTNSLGREFFELDEPEYSRNFRSPEFGLPVVKHLVSQLSLPGELKRVLEGSSLVFEVGADLFLKLTPPFFLDSFDAELAASELVKGQLEVAIPEILFHGQIENWKYLVSRRVPGTQAKHLYSALNAGELEHLASDLGALIRKYRRIDARSFERTFGPWEKYLKDRLARQESIHLAKGNSPEWVAKITEFVSERAAALTGLGPPVLVHADLNRDHVMLKQIGGQWRMVGL